MKSANEIQGLEYDWLASDLNDHIALFSTAGSGYAPPEFLRDTDAHDAAIEAILACATTGAARIAPALAPKLRNTWTMMAERGLFAFDGDPSGGPYRIVAAPAVPARLGSLPPIAVDVVSRLRLSLRFDQQTVLTAAAISRALEPKGTAS